jgi:hypothetical protein
VHLQQGFPLLFKDFSVGKISSKLMVKLAHQVFSLLIRRDFIDHKTSMITDEDPVRGLLFYWDLGFSLTLHVLTERRGR